jgi:hypothetical protein
MKLELPSLHLPCKPVSVNPDLWVLLIEFPFIIDGKVLWIPVHFICDKYSIPFFARPVYRRERKVEKENIPAWLHDYLVRNRIALGLSLMDCHNIFYQAMLLVGMWRITARIKWLGVTAGSWAVVEKGDGTPPKDVRDFIDKHGWGC